MRRFSRHVLVVLSVAVPISPCIAQTQAAPSYGYQPYNDRNPTGFNHPNNTGFGHYVYQPPATGRRFGPLKYRRFKGY
jgi:hypothetical protein